MTIPYNNSSIQTNGSFSYQEKHRDWSKSTLFFFFSDLELNYQLQATYLVFTKFLRPPSITVQIKIETNFQVTENHNI